MIMRLLKNNHFLELALALGLRLRLLLRPFGCLGMTDALTQQININFCHTRQRHFLRSESLSVELRQKITRNYFQNIYFCLLK